MYRADGPGGWGKANTRGDRTCSSGCDSRFDWVVRGLDQAVRIPGVGPADQSGGGIEIHRANDEVIRPWIFSSPLDGGRIAHGNGSFVGRCISRVLKAPHHAVYYVYVVDRRQMLVGVLNLRELMLADPEFSLFSSMKTTVTSIGARADFAAILAHPAWREFHALPVVDNGGVFVGVIRYETLRQLEADVTAERTVQPGLVTALNLGQLWWIGLTGVLASLVAPETTRQQDKPDQETRHV